MALDGVPSSARGRRRRLGPMLGVPSTPETPEEVEVFLRRRTAVYLLLLAAVWLGVHVVTFGMAALAPDGIAMVLGIHFFWIESAIIVALLGLWAIARRSDAAPVIDGAEVVGTLISASSVAVSVAALTVLGAGASMDDPEANFYVGLNTLTSTLAARAALVPSTKPRTLLVGLLASAPVVASAVIFGLARGEPLDACTGLLVTSVIWAAIGLAISGTISNVIYGMASRMRDMMRLGQYTLEDEIGAGGMGVVYRASHALLRRPTAVKVLPAERAGETALARFEREVQLTSRLTHPNTVAVYDYGKTPDGLFYYAMEYLDGFDLERLVRGDGPQEPARVLHLLRQAASALAEAHAVGLIHRDVKPSNLILCQRPLQPDLVKVLDFGLVRSLAAVDDGLSTTQTLTGTPLYMAPEQISDPDGVDGRTDLYALGAVAYFLLTGRPPFEGANVVEICGHHLHTPVVPPSVRNAGHVPPALDTLVCDLLAKRPEDRPASALALLERLEGVAAQAALDWPAAAAERWWRERADRLRRAERVATEPTVDGRKDRRVLTIAARPTPLPGF